MKKSEQKTVKETPEEELKRLRKENARLRKENDVLHKAKDEDKARIKEIKKELSKERKKKDVPKVKLSEEQWKSLSSLFPDIDTLFK